MRELCDELCPEDGVDDKVLRKQRSREDHDGPDQRTRRLCGQVRKVVEAALASADDERLWGLAVTVVEPAPDASCLRVGVWLPEPEADVPGILARLQAAKGWLRSEVARVVVRKRTPELTFVWRDGGAT